MLELVATTAHRARLAELLPKLDQVASADVPRLFGRGSALEQLHQQLAPAIRQARDAQRQLGEVPELRRIAERMDATVGAAETLAARDPRDIARELSVGLQRIDTELSPSAQRVDELFARDASTWSKAEIEELRTIFLDGPEAARPPVFGGPYRHKKETFDLKANLDYMATTHDATDLAIANRFAADWRLMRDPTVTRESLALRVDEIFAKDAAAWTSREIHDLRAIWNAPDELRPQAIGGPYTVKNETFTIQSALDWMTTTHDATDISISNRFAAAWRAAGLDASPETVAAKVDEIFRRDSSSWTSQEITELRTLLYDIPEGLRPTHGPEALGKTVNFRLIAGPQEEGGVRYTLQQVMDYMATTHDATDLQMANMYAEAWLLASREAKDAMLARLHAHAATGEAIVGPGGRPPTEVTISILRDEFLASSKGVERAQRAASLLSFANTRRETLALLTDVKDSLPNLVHRDIKPLVDQTNTLVKNNIRRIHGYVPDGEVRGMRDHARMDEVGRIQSLVRTIRDIESPLPRAAAEPAAPAPNPHLRAEPDAIAW